MKFATPEEIETVEQEEKEQRRQSLPDLSETVVDMGEMGPMPLEKVLHLHQEMLERPEAFGIASSRRVMELEQLVERQSKMLVEQREVIDLLVDTLRNVGYVEGEADWDIYDPMQEFEGE